MIRRLALISLGIAALCLAAPALWAEGEKRLVAVELSGTKTIARETILAKVETKPGNPYIEAVVNEDIRRIFSLGYFTDVKADLSDVPEGLKLTFIVKEKPTITAVEFKGHRALQAPKLRELVGIGNNTLYDPKKVKDGVEQIKAEYARRGFSSCAVASRIQTHEASNTATLYIAIDEGARMRIRRVWVEGNQAFSDGRIRSLLKTKTRRWIFLPSVYNEQVLTEDLERVRAFYRKNGYQDVAVSRQAYADSSGRGVDVLFNISEGLQHRVGQVGVAGNLLFPEREIRLTLTLKPGSIYTDDGLQEDLRRIKQYYGDRGHIHAEIVPEPQLDPATKRVNLTYRITERELVYVNRVEIRGNLQTKDAVIRRELRIYPADSFNGARIRKSVERLYNLGFFEDVNIETEPAQAADREDLIVKVKEAKTGSFSFGGGFSSVDRLVGLVELEQRNFDWRNWSAFTGAGEDLRLRVEIGSSRRYYDVSFTEPWIFNQPVSFGVDLYNRTHLRSSTAGLAFDERTFGSGVRLGREFADTLQTGLSYQFYTTKISGINNAASADLRAEEGTKTISVVGTSLGWDKRDNRLEPTQGYFVFGSADVAGTLIGGDRDFYRLQAGASNYWSHAERFVLESYARTGLVQAYSSSKEVPIFERFFSGGSSTVRGFRERRVGPLDPLSNDPIGGEATLTGTLEEVMTIMKNEHGKPILRGSVFFDVGNVWRRVHDYGHSFKAGTGVGTRVNTPIGPVRLDLGFPITKEERGKSRRPQFHFNISRGF